MIVCLCKKVNDQSIRTLVQAGLRYQAIVDTTEMTKGCGGCKNELTCIILDEDTYMKESPSGGMVYTKV